VGGTRAFEPELIGDDAATLCLRIINKMAASLEAAASQVVVALVQHSLKHALQPYARSRSIVSSFMKYFSVIFFFFLSNENFIENKTDPSALEMYYGYNTIKIPN